jgi:hypothetical protein
MLRRGGGWGDGKAFVGEMLSKAFLVGLGLTRWEGFEIGDGREEPLTGEGSGEDEVVLQLIDKSADTF